MESIDAFIHPVGRISVYIVLGGCLSTIQIEVYVLPCMSVIGIPYRNPKTLVEIELAGECLTSQCTGETRKSNGCAKMAK